MCNDDKLLDRMWSVSLRNRAAMRVGPCMHRASKVTCAVAIHTQSQTRSPAPQPERPRPTQTAAGKSTSTRPEQPTNKQRPPIATAPTATGTGTGTGTGTAHASSTLSPAEVYNQFWLPIEQCATQRQTIENFHGRCGFFCC